MMAPNDGETPNCFNLTPTKTINISSRIFRLLILYARHRIISKKLATSNESAPESMQQTRSRANGGCFWLNDFDEGRRWEMWKMCPTEIWMCIKLLVGTSMDVSLKIIDEITPKKFYLKMLPAPVHKPLLGFRIWPCELWFHTLQMLRVICSSG